MENEIPPFDPSSTVIHKFKFLDDDMNNDSSDSISSIPSTGIYENTSSSAWDSIDDGDEGLITGSSSGSSVKRSIYFGSSSDSYESPERKRVRKE